MRGNPIKRRPACTAVERASSAMRCAPLIIGQVGGSLVSAAQIDRLMSEPTRTGRPGASSARQARDKVTSAWRTAATTIGGRSIPLDDGAALPGRRNGGRSGMVGCILWPPPAHELPANRRCLAGRLSGRPSRGTNAVSSCGRRHEERAKSGRSRAQWPNRRRSVLIDLRSTGEFGLPPPLTLSSSLQIGRPTRLVSFRAQSFGLTRTRGPADGPPAGPNSPSGPQGANSSNTSRVHSRAALFPVNDLNSEQDSRIGRS
jgi:hypothetical protein